MPNLAYSADIQDQVAYALYGAAYSSLSTNQKSLIDGNSAVDPPTAGVAQRAYRRVQQMAQWWELAGATTTTDNAEAWLVHEIIYLAAPTLRPERVGEFRDLRNEAMRTYLDSITPIEITTGYDANVFAPTLQSIRYYVLSNLTAREKPLLVAPDSIDSATFWCLNWLWNRSQWSFRRRKLSGYINSVAVTGATWEESTKTVTETDGFANYPYSSAGVTDHVSGATFLVTDGTSAVKGVNLITQKVSNSQVVLAQSLSVTADDLSTGDIDGYAISVNVFGLQAGDRLDSIITRKLYVVGEDRAYCEWVSADQMAALLARSDAVTGIPRYFRIEKQNDSTGVPITVWYFWPIPDQAYTVQFDGLLMLPGTTSPGVPTDATDTTPFSKFPQEFKSVLKDLVLGQVLLKARREPEVWQAAEQEVEKHAKSYDDPGLPTSDGGIRDVYNDVADLGGDFLSDMSGVGGPM